VLIVKNLAWLVLWANKNHGVAAGEDGRKAAASLRTPDWSRWTAAGAANSCEKWGLEAAVLEMKKAAEKLPPTKKPTPLPGK